jgi:plasmid stability protein
MLEACVNVLHMSVMIQIRNVPEGLHRKLKIRAVEAGMSLSDYLLKEIERTASRPTIDELLERIKRDPGVRPKENSVDAVRAERSAR